MNESPDAVDPMSSCEPINLFSSRIDPRGVVAVLMKTGLPVEVEGPEDDWSQITVYLPPKTPGEPGSQLVIGHRAEYYDGENWPEQVTGMQGYFSSFPATPNMPEIMRLIGSFRFALSVPSYDLSLDSDDERLKLLYLVCEHLDGVVFTPSSLRDSKGRMLYCTEGTFDPAAVSPTLPPIEVVERSDEDEVYKPPVPHSAERVARRAMALTAVAARATLELDAPEIDDPEEHRQGLIDWVNGLGIGDELEPQEWKVLQRAVGKLEQQDFFNAMWRVEGLVVLSWALQLHALPPDDELVFPVAVYESMGLYDAKLARATLANPQLRSADDLEAMQIHLLMFHWRMRNYHLRPQSIDFAAMSLDCWVGSFDISTFRLVDNDLAIGDVGIVDADDNEVRRVHSTAMERHLAINWLMGHSEVYSETDTST